MSQPAGNNKVVKLELSLAQDTGASNNDNYTRNGQVNVSGIPSGSDGNTVQTVVKLGILVLVTRLPYQTTPKWVVLHTAYKLA